MDGLGSKTKEEHNPIINPTSLSVILRTPCTQPLDVIKTRLQLDKRGHYKGIIHCGVSIVKSEGVRALWKGFTPAFTQKTFAFTHQIASYAFLHTTDFNTPENFLTTMIMSTPFDVVRMRLQQQNNHYVKYKGALHCVRTIIREERIRGLWVGFTPALIRHSIQRGSILAAAKLGKKYEIEKENKRIIPWLVWMEASLLVVGGVVCSNPFDVVQTRLMTQGGSDEVNKYKGMVHAFKTIYSEEGFLALWRSLMLRIIMIPSSVLISFLIVNQLNRSFDTIKDSKVKVKFQ